MFSKSIKSCWSFIASNKPGVLCVFGGFLLNLCFSLDFSYANLNTYVTSYMRSNGHNPDLQYNDFIFLTASKQISQGFFMFAAGLISQRVGARIAILVGCFTLILGYSTTFFTLKSFFPLLIVSMGICHGIGFCLVYATAVGVAQQWFPAKIRGFVSSVVLSGYGFGSLIWIPMQTAFINPDNVNPDQDDYYSDPELLDRVPYVFLLMAGVLVVLAIPGILLVREPKEDHEDLVTASEKPPPVSLTVWQVVRTGVFYKIWLGQFAISLSLGLLGNWQKTFGLTLVVSDRFHSTVGILVSLCNGFSRIMWGVLYDRLGYRKSVLAIGLVVTLSISSLPLLTYCEKDSTLVQALWILIMCANYSTFPGSFPIMAASVHSAFGPAHYRANFGILFTITLANYGTLMICSQVPAIFDSLGYSGMFLLAGGVGVLGMVVTFFAPDRFDSREVLASLEGDNKLQL